MALFRNRQHAAEELAQHLLFLKDEKPIVLGLANGGIPLAEVIAEYLNAPLDVLLLERLCAPNSDHIVGAVDEHGRISLIQATARWHHVTTQAMIEPARDVFRALQKRRDRIREILPELDVRGRTVIIVSQGIGVGAKLLGAIASMRDRGASKVIAAAPVGHTQSTWPLHEMAHLVIVPHQSGQFKEVQQFYDSLAKVTDDMMLAIIETWAQSRPSMDDHVTTIHMKIKNRQGMSLSCDLDLPPGTKRGSGPYPAVIFAHGFDSNSQSERSVPISRRLAKRGIVGARLDFTGHGRSEGSTEDATDVQMLDDMHAVFEAVAHLNEVDPDRMGVNGAGSGAMIALYYATKQPLVHAMVIRGPICGREIQAARQVRAPTLIIHAERDTALQEPVEVLNREIAATHELLVISNCNRLFNDPISKELMVNASVDWFADHLLRRALDDAARSKQEGDVATA